jgi:hypothetical protein
MNSIRIVVTVLLAGVLSTISACQTMNPQKYAESPKISRVSINGFEKTSHYEQTNDNYNEHYLVTIKTRPLVFQKFLLSKPNNPVASVILFAGGHGALDMQEESGKLLMGLYKYNFLVRTRSDFSNHNLMVAVVDAPSDKGIAGMSSSFRTSEEHVKDIEEVISFLKKESDIPVWLVGTSKGTESAAHVAIHTNQAIAGLVLTSSMSGPSLPTGKTVTSMDLAKIRVPSLIVAHEKDGCFVTPPSGSETIKKGLINAQKVEVKYFSGGKYPLTSACDALSEHGFFGIEKEVVSYIANFIKSNVH